MTNIQDFISTSDASNLENVLRQANYRQFIRTLKDSGGIYYFRVHDAQSKVIGRSREYSDKIERDKDLHDFITFIEVEIHGRLQMELF